jgi:hypothetical protein
VGALTSVVLTELPFSVEGKIRLFFRQKWEAKSAL